MSARILNIPRPTAPDSGDAALPEWITTSSLAALAGIAPRNARAAAASCLEVGRTWRGAALLVRNEGRALLIHGPSLPPDLRDIWHKRYLTGTALDLPTSATLPAPSSYDSGAGKRFAEIRWKLEILGPALDQPPHSRARGAELRTIAAKEHQHPNGKWVKIARSTLDEWMRNLVTKGEVSLARKRPTPGTPRVIINRAWDAACPLSDDEKQQIRSDLETYLKTEWSKGVPGVYRIIEFASSKLVEFCRVKGWAAASLENCHIGRHLAEKYRAWALVAEKERNAKKFFDKRIPRISINREKLKPGDVVVGDVHHFDVAKADGNRTVHAKLICWLDLATYDIFVTVVICGEGRSIRQEDVAGSFVDMVEAWGLPKQLRLDNGKEYKWEAMMAGFNTLAGLVRDFGQLFLPTITGKSETAELLAGYSFEPRHAVSRARPYNAPAKQIESVFGILEYWFFALMPGWVAGDRLNKRTHKVGEAPRAHDGTDADFLRDINICLDLYRNAKQKGVSSPSDKRRAAYDAGCCPVRVGREVFLFAFSEVRRFTVHPRGVEVDGLWGICDAIVPFIGQRVDIRVVKWDRSNTFYLDRDGKLHALPMGRAFDHDNPEGAKEQGRLTKVLNTHIRELKAATTDMDILGEGARHLTHMRPAPQLPSGPTIRTTEGTAIATALTTVATPAPVRLKPGEMIHPTTGEVLSIAAPKNDRPGANDSTPGPFGALPPPTCNPAGLPYLVPTKRGK